LLMAEPYDLWFEVSAKSIQLSITIYIAKKIYKINNNNFKYDFFTLEIFFYSDLINYA